MIRSINYIYNTKDMKDGKVFGFEELVVIREGYVPRTFKEIKEEIDRKNYNPEDILEITAP